MTQKKKMKSTVYIFRICGYRENGGFVAGGKRQTTTEMRVFFDGVYFGCICCIIGGIALSAAARPDSPEFISSVLLPEKEGWMRTAGRLPCFLFQTYYTTMYASYSFLFIFNGFAYAFPAQFFLQEIK
jgi:hypothetical protein